MSQETNLNVSPYFDDFDPQKDYYKVLFKPGYPVQARELNTLQSIAQNQTEQFGKHIFKEGSVVIPGQLKYENPLYAVQIESEFNGIPISSYFNDLKGVKIKGFTSGVSAEVVLLLTNSDSERGNYTLYVKYLGSGGDNFDTKTFLSSETLILESDVSFGSNSFLQTGEGFANTISENAVTEGSAVSISEGVYFVRGVFARVKSQTIILDQYGITPSYKVGFDVLETIVNSDEDDTLFDNSKGFSNFAAPGADRFKIELKLSKREIDDLNTDSFVEILRVENAAPQFFDEDPQYNLIRDELARRTYDESGDYFVKPFTVNVRDSLNDRVLNRGIYFEGQTTSEGNIPSEDSMVYQIGPGKAYVRGYDVETISPTLIDVKKARTTEKSPQINLNYNSGTLAILNNGTGAPSIGLGTDSVVYLQDERKGSDSNVAAGTTIGVARVYDFVPESDYVDQTSRLQLRLFDIRTYTTVGLTTSIPGGLSLPAFIRGKNSNATGFLKTALGPSDTEMTLYETTGNFLENEQIVINGIDNGRLINSVTDYSVSDIKSVYATNSVGLSTFNADLVLSKKSYIAKPGTTFKVDNGVVSAGLDTKFTNIVKVGDIVSYASTEFTGDPIYNRVTDVGIAGTNFTISSITDVSGVCNGTLPSGSFEVTNILKYQPSLKSRNNSLLTKLNHENVSEISLNETEIIQRRTFNVASFTGSSFSITIDADDVDLFFESFDEDRYLISYEDGTTELMRADKFLLSLDGKTVTFNGLSKASGSNAEVIATVKNIKPSSKNKKLNKVGKITIENSSSVASGIGTTTLNDGLSYSNVYGTRVQDKEISLNVPDVVRVLAVYESNDTSNPTLPQLQLTGSSGNSNYIVGEHIEGKTSGAVALVTSKVGVDKLEYVYLNTSQFSLGEVIFGKDSKEESLLSLKILSDKNITQNFDFDNGQRDTFYDFSRILRRQGVESPKKKLTVVFQNYTIDSSDTGEFITANSYSQENFKHDVGFYQGSRLTDFVDIRPRVAPYTLTNKSPFEFDSRNFASDGQYSEYILVPDENILLDYEYYVGRIDTIFLNPDGQFQILSGEPSANPQPAESISTGLSIATVFIPPFVFNTKNINVLMSVHKRYRMQDISLLEDRIHRVERFTTLSMLESKTENFMIRDAETGLDRFKCGFFVDNFSNHAYHDLINPNFKAAIDTSSNALRPRHYTTSLDLQLGSEVIEGFTSTFTPNADSSFVSDLGSVNVRKTGDLVTLNYDSVLYFEQPYGTKTESVTPFLVRYWQGSIQLNPPVDVWFDEVARETNATQEVVNRVEREDENITVVNNVTVDNEVFVGAGEVQPVPQTGIAPFDWIQNARDIVNNLSSTLSTKRAKLGGLRIVVDNNKNSSNVRSSGAGERKSVIGTDIIHLNVWKSSVKQADRDLINQLLPPDAATQFLTAIDTKNWKRRAVINFIPSTGATTVTETNTSVETTTSTETTSDVSTIIIPEEIITDTNTETSTENFTEEVRFLRSRNIEFDTTGLRPRTRFYPFFEGIDVSNYVIPKLLEIEMISGSFTVGETVISDPVRNVSKEISFRLCTPNHKSGPFDGTGDGTVFKLNPYTLQSFENSYTASSTLLNVDTRSLELPEETEYYGWIEENMRLIGKDSGAVAEIKSTRLISDNSGRLIGSLFIVNPNVPENPRWINGENTFTLIDTPSLSNLNQVFNEFTPNQRITESGGEAEFTSAGTINITQTNILTTRNVTVLSSFNRNTTTITNTTTNTTTTTETTTTTTTPGSGGGGQIAVWENHDPLAQSFYVRDNTGIFLTDVEVFFETKDEELPVTLQIRPMIAGVPSNEVVPFSEVTLDPDQVVLSADGSVPTKFTFPSPVYLPGPQSLEVRSAPIASQQSSVFSVVLLSGSPNYRVYIAELGQDDIQTGIKISKQPTLGSLFKSQNGSTWTPSQLEDMKYRLYRADFTTNPGLVKFFNPKLGVGNKKVTVTGTNQFLPLSKKIIVGLGSDGYDASGLVEGASLVQGTATGNLVGLAGSVTTLSVINTGTGYTSGTFTGVELQTDTGDGTGAIATLEIDSSGIGTATITSGGLNYLVGDVLSLPSREFGLDVGFGGKVGVTSISAISNTLIIDNVQGEFEVGINSIFYTNGGGTDVSTGATISSIINDPYYDGLHMKISHLNHGMHSSENYVKIEKVRPLLSEVNSALSSDITSTDTTLPLDSVSGFETFEGQTVSGTYPGYVIVGNEVMEYTSVSGNTLTVNQRGIDGTLAISYSSGTRVAKYEFNGVSLRRINKVHNFAEVDRVNHPTTLNSYFIKIDNSDTDFDNNVIGKDRSITSKLYFADTERTGRTGSYLSNNIQYESIVPNIANILPGKTSLKSRIRTFSGTSISGSEKSFVDNGFQNLNLNEINYLGAPCLICSQENESRFITESPGNRSLSIEVDLNTTDSRVSPVIDTVQTSVVLTSNLINSPTGGVNETANYKDNTLVRSINDDDHACIYLSKPVRLKIPANSIKVLLKASHMRDNDIRVLYQLYRDDAPESAMNYELFPGFSNYRIDGDGIKRVIDTRESDGTNDSKVIFGDDPTFKDYEYSVDDLPEFNAFAIKIVMASQNQALVPQVKDLRAIATIKPKL